jgi:hypothetical protein
MAAQGQKLRKKNWQQYRKNMSKKRMCSKLSAVVAPANLYQ